MGDDVHSKSGDFGFMFWEPVLFVQVAFAFARRGGVGVGVGVVIFV